MTHEAIATALNVSRSTIERDIRDFLDNDNWRQWLTEDWLQLHGQLKESNPVECYRALTQLIKRSGDYNLVQNNISQIRVVFGDNLTVTDNANNDQTNPDQTAGHSCDSEGTDANHQ